MSEGIDVRVENRLIRFIPATPVDQARVEADLGGVRAGELVVVALTRPSATVIVDAEGVSSFTARTVWKRLKRRPKKS